MAVKIREDGRLIYRPYGALSKEDMLRADKLDEVLKIRMPVIAQKTDEFAQTASIIEKWHFFGTQIAEIVDDTNLVLRADVKSGDIWWALRQKLPETFGLKDTGEERDASDPKNKNRDHLSMIYVLSKFKLEDIRWIKRWRDWKGIHNRKSLFADMRIFYEIKKRVSSLDKYPKDPVFKALIEELGRRFPEGISTQEFTDEKIKKIVLDTINKHVASN